jgi:transcriptional regulator with GAF, ATPase, and Fis domain
MTAPEPYPLLREQPHVTVEAAPQMEDVAATLIRLADTLVEDFDLLAALHELTRDCVALLNVTAAGLLLAPPGKQLGVVAASSEQSRLLELAQLQRDQGPCLDCYRTGEPVSVHDLTAHPKQWPLFSDAALSAGYRSVHAIPMRLRSQVIGALNLFSKHPDELSGARLRLGQALADMATISILQAQALRESEDLAGQLQFALTSRVILEQAKGVLAERGQLSMEQAFVALRRYARDHNQRLHEVSLGIVNSTISPALVIGPPRRERPLER